MRLKLLTLALLFFAFSMNLMATNPVTTSSDEVAVEGFTMLNKQAKTNVFTKVKTWVNKKVVKTATWLAKKAAGIDFNDESSILKLWIVCLVAGLVLYLVAAFVFWPLSILGYLLWLAGVILFWYWVYLKFIK